MADQTACTFESFQGKLLQAELRFKSSSTTLASNQALVAHGSRADSGGKNGKILFWPLLQETWAYRQELLEVEQERRRWFKEWPSKPCCVDNGSSAQLLWFVPYLDWRLGCVSLHVSCQRMVQ